MKDTKSGLIHVLDSVRGRKSLVLDHELVTPLSLLAEFPVLKEHEPTLETEASCIVYLTRPFISNMKMIACKLNLIQAHIKSRKVPSQFSIFMVPRKTLLCERILEEEGVFGDAKIGEFEMDFVPIDEIVYSLELNNSFADLYLRKDTSCVYAIAKAVMQWQMNDGLIPRIIGKGEYAQLFVDHLSRMKREHQSSLNFYSQSVDSIVVLERGLDMLSPMCTQLTYEGLLDEIFGIDSTFIAVPQKFLGTSTTSSSQKTKKIPLNSGDSLFSEIRDMNFAIVGNTLSSHAKRLYEDYEARHHVKTVGQIKEFVGKLGGLQTDQQSLRLHTNLAEEITRRTVDQEFNKILEIQQNFVAGIISTTHLDYLEELIAKQAPLTTLLRVLCIYSLVNGGIQAKKFDQLRRDILQTYGFKNLLTFDNLSKVGLLKKQDPSLDTYGKIRKNLRVIVDDVDERNPNDISYVYSGFAPISIRLLQIACFKSISSNLNAEPKKHIGPPSWKGWEDIVRLVPGSAIEQIQKANQIQFPTKVREGKKTTLVVFIGGCTFTEISAIRYLSAQYGDRDFKVLTTHITNGHKMIDSLAENSLYLK